VDNGRNTTERESAMGDIGNIDHFGFIAVA